MTGIVLSHNLTFWQYRLFFWRSNVDWLSLELELVNLLCLQYVGMIPYGGSHVLLGINFFGQNPMPISR